MNLEPKFISLITSHIKKHLPNAQIFLFGSRTRGNNKEFSDVDIAIKDMNLSSAKLAIIKFEIEESNLPYKIDLVNFDDLPQDILSDAVKI